MANTADPATIPTVFQVRNFIDANQLKKDLAYSPNDLTGAMMQQASLLAHYGMIYADAAKQEDVVEMLMQNTEAAVYKQIRDELASRGEKHTEALLDKMVTRHEKVIGMRKALNEAKRVAAICKTAVEAFRHRKDMLVSQGLQAREEMKGELYIRGRAAVDEVRKVQESSMLEKLRQIRSSEET